MSPGRALISDARRGLDSLYPAAAFDLLVNPSLPAPRLACPPQERNNPDPTRYRDYYGPNIRHEISVPGQEERVAIIDKAWPHTINDVMLLVASDQYRHTNVDSVPDAVLDTLLQCALAYVDLVCASPPSQNDQVKGGRLTIGWNFDPTLDRDNGQWWDKTMHWHLNLYPPQVFTAESPMAFGDVTDSRVRRALIDPTAYLAAQVLSRALYQGADVALPGHRLILPAGCVGFDSSPHSDAHAHLPIGLKIRLPGWNFLTTQACRDLLRNLHQLMTSTYHHVRSALTSSARMGPAWTRPQLRPPAETKDHLSRLAWLDRDTREGLLHLHALLRDISPRQMDALQRNRDLASRFLTLAGLSYNITLTTRTPVGADLARIDDLFLVVQVKLFSWVGHSPALGQSVAAIIDRHRGPIMDDSMLQHRAHLQREFVTHASRRLRARDSTVPA